MELVCRAIHARRTLEFDYDGKRRVVQPYCHGFGSKGQELLRAIQIGGRSRSGGLGFGKLWLLEKMSNVRLTEEMFLATDPDYNPDDGAMPEIHCRV